VFPDRPYRGRRICGEKLLPRLSDTGSEAGESNSQRVRHIEERLHARIAFAALEESDVVAVHARAIRQFFLAESLRLAMTTDFPSKCEEVFVGAHTAKIVDRWAVARVQNLAFRPLSRCRSPSRPLTLAPREPISRVTRWHSSQVSAAVRIQVFGNLKLSGATTP
jgi:hypothetical protein